MHGIDGRPSRPRLVALWTGLIAVAGIMVALFLPPLSQDAVDSDAAQPNPRLSQATAGETCLRLSENPSDTLSEEGWRRRTELRIANCKMAFAPEPENMHFKVAVARALPYAQRAESLTLLREQPRKTTPRPTTRFMNRTNHGTRRPRRGAAGNARRGRSRAAQSRRTRTSLCHANAGRSA